MAKQNSMVALRPIDEHRHVAGQDSGFGHADYRAEANPIHFVLEDIHPVLLEPPGIVQGPVKTGRRSILTDSRCEELGTIPVRKSVAACLETKIIRFRVKENQGKKKLLVLHPGRT